MNLLHLLSDTTRTGTCILIFCCLRVYEAVWDLAHGDLDMDGTFPDRHADISGRNDDAFNISQSFVRPIWLLNIINYLVIMHHFFQGAFADAIAHLQNFSSTIKENMQLRSNLQMACCFYCLQKYSVRSSQIHY